ncbi:MAG: hypothetical protein JWM31_2743 [Solirubrobacterales bacterium]|nr:hypothetical protein [Solirubrobacterales bacterium]
MGAPGLAQAYATTGTSPPIPVRELASAMIALDVGLALQHFVDPDGAPLARYPRLYETLFGPLAPQSK